jgi:REP element-mobilizing transposase RayT
MKFDPQIHHRRSIRLEGYDYTQRGAYWITIVTYQRQCLFGEVVNGEMRLNECGQIAHNEWFKTAALRPYVKLYEDEFVVMPNHVHGIIWITTMMAAWTPPCPDGG